MRQTKIINDPIYGFVTVSDIFLKITQHPYFQRLHNIQQLAVAHFVYPGATHTRLHHSLGAFYLMGQALHHLQEKGVKLTVEEKKATLIAILLHDSGHTPLSHLLEKLLLENTPHEVYSAMVMLHLKEELHLSEEERQIFTLAHQIFTGNYTIKPFLHQLISSQMDMDRMDYLTRDSFYTGVAEGAIGYKRILQTIYIHDGDLIVEDKGIYAVEKFLIARYFMRWQVYFHKNVWILGELILRVLRRVKEQVQQGIDFTSYMISPALFHLLKSFDPEYSFHYLMQIDDHDIWVFLKHLRAYPDKVIQLLLSGIFQRHTYRVRVFQADRVEEVKILLEDRKKLLMKQYKLKSTDADYLLFHQFLNVKLYEEYGELPLRILFKNGEVSNIQDTAHSLLSYEAPKRQRGKIYLVAPATVMKE